MTTFGGVTSWGIILDIDKLGPIDLEFSPESTVERCRLLMDTLYFPIRDFYIKKIMLVLKTQLTLALGQFIHNKYKRKLKMYLHF